MFDLPLIGRCGRPSPTGTGCLHEEWYYAARRQPPAPGEGACRTHDD